MPLNKKKRDNAERGSKHYHRLPLEMIQIQAIRL